MICRMGPVRIALLCACLPACGAPGTMAPKPLEARSSPREVSPPVAVDPEFVAWLPERYEAEIFVDYDALRACDLMDVVERVPMVSEFLDSLAKGYGCSFDELRLTRTGIGSIEPGDSFAQRTISVARIAARPLSRTMPAPWQPLRFSHHDGFYFVEGVSRPPAVLWPSADLAVAGDRDLLLRAANGESRGGPHPELQPLLPVEGTLAQVAVGCFERKMHESLGTIGWFWHDEQDPARFVRFALSYGDDEQVVLSMTVRFLCGTTGLTEVEKDLRQKLDAVLGDESLRSFHELVSDLQLVHLGKDLHATLPLGSVREAYRKLERAAFALMAIAASRR